MEKFRKDFGDSLEESLLPTYLNKQVFAARYPNPQTLFLYLRQNHFARTACARRSRMAGVFFNAHSTRLFRYGIRSPPESVKRYSTRGGTSG